jgi:hypothetical protein
VSEGARILRRLRTPLKDPDAALTLQLLSPGPSHPSSHPSANLDPVMFNTHFVITGGVIFYYRPCDAYHTS